MSLQDLTYNRTLYGDLFRDDLFTSPTVRGNVDTDFNVINPASSGAYTPQSARNIYGSTPEVENPIAAFSDYKPYSGMNLLSQGMQGLSYGQMASQLSPYLASGASNLYGTLSGTKMGLPGAQTFDLGPAATLYGLTQNQNPYDFTRTEQLGTIGATAMGVGQLGKLFSVSPATKLFGAKGVLGMNPYLLIGGLLLGGLFSRKKKKKAKKMKTKVYKDIKEQTDDIYETRADAVEEMREDMLSRQTSDMYEQRQGRYDNMYGGNYDARIYNAEEGMKMDDDIVAEFTGNELIVNDQDELEKDLAQGNNARVAARIRKAMKGGKITPGKETHKSNPIPVGSDGTIYAKGGPMPFKVNKGAGVYDHATDQFKMTMTDNEITDVVKKNMKKWEKNNMA
jgi:hypothetical protein